MRGSAHLVLAVALNGAGGFAFWWVAAWRLPAADVGAAEELFTALMALTCLTSMGLPIAVARFSADETAASATIFRWSLVYTAATSALGAALLVWTAPGGLLAPIRSLGGPGAFFVLGLLTAGMSFAVLVEVRLMAMRRWGWVVGRVLLVVGVRIPLLWVDSGVASRWLFVLVAGAPALSGLLGSAVLHRTSPARAGWWRRLPDDTLDLLRYSTVHFVGLLGSQGPMFLIPLVVAVTVDSASYAPFYIAWAITQTAFVIPHMLGQTFLVETAKSGVDEDRHRLVTLVLAAGTMGVIAVASFVVGPVLSWSLGSEYRVCRGPVAVAPPRLHPVGVDLDGAGPGAVAPRDVDRGSRHGHVLRARPSGRWPC